MYARINLSSGCTLQQLRDDIVGLLCGTITSAASLASASASTSEIVIVEAAEWTFVQHLADTSSRCHFVLAGTDAAGVKKTLGIALTNTGGILGFWSWHCGEWDSTNKWPAAIDVTGWAIATGYGSAANFAAGSIKNGLCSHSNGSTPVAFGAFTSGLMQLQITSAPGVTGLYCHLSGVHSMMLDIVDIDRAYSPLWAVDEWPFILILATASGQYGAQNAGCQGPGLSAYSADASLVGLINGPSGWSTTAAPLTSELGVGVRTWNISTSASTTITHAHLGRNTADVFHWFPKKDGVQVQVPRPNIATPRGTYYCASAVPVKHRIPGQFIPVGGSATVVLAYVDELVAGSETYVGTGTGQFSVFKG